MLERQELEPLQLPPDRLARLQQQEMTERHRPAFVQQLLDEVLAWRRLRSQLFERPTERERLRELPVDDPLPEHPDQLESPLEELPLELALKLRSQQVEQLP